MATRHAVTSSTPGFAPALLGFADVADEAARAAVAIATVDVGKVIDQTAGDHPGYYIAVATGIGLDKWHRLDLDTGILFEGPLTIKTPSINGAALDFNVVNAIAATAFGDPGNPSFLLPTTTAATRIGSTVSVLFAMSALDSEIAQLTPQGTDVLLSGTASYQVVGDTLEVFFVFVGDIGGVNGWLPVPTTSLAAGSATQRAGLIRRAAFMTVRQLPAFTASGSGLSLILTGDVDGALVIDGEAVGAEDKVAVAHEVGANRAYHGLYRVQQTGDGSNPYILSVDPSWAQDLSVYGPFGSIIWADSTFGEHRVQGVLMSFQDHASVPGAEKNAIRIDPHRVKYADYATTGPLPAFTASGDPSTADLVLTGNANGALVIDNGTTLALNDLVFVIAEVGTDRQYHGIFNVEQVGDGSNPYILRKWWTWAHADDAREGAIVAVIGGSGSAATPGRVYLWPAASPGDESDARQLGDGDALDLGTVSGAFNLDVRASKRQRFKLGGNATLTFTGFDAFTKGRVITLEIEQSVGGADTLTYANALAPGGVAPVLSVAADAIDRVRAEVSFNGGAIAVTSIGQAYS